jgi:hypothetical protein
MVAPNIPASPTAEHKQGSSFQPHELNPDLAYAQMFKDLLLQMGQPSVVSKRFVVWQGIWEGLNDTQQNKTGYNCQMKVDLYAHIAKNSVNIDGKWFNGILQVLMKPKYIITQASQLQGNAFQEDEPGLIRSVWNRLTGQGKKEEPQNANG